MGMGRKHSSHFKFKVALEGLKEEKTQSQVCQEYQIHSSVLQRWKKELKEKGYESFEKSNPSLKRKEKALEEEISDLQKKVGELLMERDFLKKVLSN